MPRFLNQRGTCRPAPRAASPSSPPLRLPACSWFLACGLAAAPSPRAQSGPAHGFAAPVVLEQNAMAQFVRGTGHVAQHGWFEAIGNRLTQRTQTSTNTVLQLPAGDDLTLVEVDDSDRIWTTALLAGTVHVHDPATGTTSQFPGVANTFSLAPLANGQVLLSANPLWPAAGAHTGIWLAGAGLVPREILALNGPSGPILVDDGGALFVGELAPAPRLLRIPAGRLQQALAGSTLAAGDADLVGFGWPGLYDLGRWPQGGIAVTTGLDAAVWLADAALSPAQQPLLDLQNGELTLQLQLERNAGGGSPFAAFQPAERAPALLLATSNFISSYAVRRLAPSRPALAPATPGPYAPGRVTLLVADAPAASPCLVLLNVGQPTVEWPPPTRSGSDCRPPPARLPHSYCSATTGPAPPRCGTPDPSPSTSPRKRFR